MAMVMSSKSKMCVCSLIMLILLGVGLAVVSTVVYARKEHHSVGTAEKYSQTKTAHHTVERVSEI